MKRETKQDRAARLFDRLSTLGFTYGESYSLRRIEMTLSRWSAMECGDEFGRCVERDEKTGKPFITYEMSNGERTKPRRIPDREKGALKRLAAIVEARNLRHPENRVAGYHQSDPRGCALYIVPLSELRAPENQIVKLAQNFGAVITKNDERDQNPRPVGGIRQGDIYYTLGDGSGEFNTPEEAARRYLIDKGHCNKDRMPSRDFTLDQVYTRGVAVCY